ncbi:MAG: hypothetical protein ACT4N4_01310 [Rhodospirillales bacterium]
MTSGNSDASRRRPQQRPVGRTVLAALAAPFVGLLAASAAFGLAANIADRPADQTLGEAVMLALGGAWIYTMFGFFMALPATWAVGAPLHLLFVKRGWTGPAPYAGAGLALGLLAGLTRGRPLDFLYFGLVGGLTATSFWWLVHRWR